MKNHLKAKIIVPIANATPLDPVRFLIDPTELPLRDRWFHKLLGYSKTTKHQIANEVVDYIFENEVDQKDLFDGRPNLSFIKLARDYAQNLPMHQVLGLYAEDIIDHVREHVVQANASEFDYIAKSVNARFLKPLGVRLIIDDTLKDQFYISDPFVKARGTIRLLTPSEVKHAFLEFLLETGRMDEEENLKIKSMIDEESALEADFAKSHPYYTPHQIALVAQDFRNDTLGQEPLTHNILNLWIERLETNIRMQIQHALEVEGDQKRGEPLGDYKERVTKRAGRNLAPLERNLMVEFNRHLKLY